MTKENWTNYIDQLNSLLSNLVWTDGTGTQQDSQDAFATLRDRAMTVRDRGRTIYLVGNGASASMCSHFSADLAKNADLHTEVFSDLSLITAISNDMGYENVFSVPLSRRAKPSDMLIAISSSGASPNILKAVEVARGMGVYVATLSAMRPENPLRGMGDLNAYVPADDYGPAETCHAAILHYWMDMMERP